MMWPATQHGDWRNKRRFAWLPVKIGGYWVWLRRYWTADEYRENRGWETHYLSTEGPIDYKAKNKEWAVAYGQLLAKPPSGGSAVRNAGALEPEGENHLLQAMKAGWPTLKIDAEDLEMPEAQRKAWGLEP